MYRAIAVLVLLAAPMSAQMLMTTDKNSSTATLVDLKSGNTLATLPTGNAPHELAISPDGKLAVVTDYGAQQGGTTLTVIDIATRKVARTISFAPYQRPHGASFMPDNRTLVVTAERNGLIALVDVVSGEIKGTKPTGQTIGHMVALSHDARTAYVANISPGTLSIIDLAGTADPVIVKVGTQTEAINTAPDGNTVWMGSNNTGKVYVIDTHQRRVIDSLQTPGFPYRIDFTPDSRTAVISNPENNEVRIVDAITRRIVSVVSTPGGPQGIAMSPKGDIAWVTLEAGDAILEIDIKQAKVIRTLQTGDGPDGIRYIP